jgi:glycosyltransferase involved in cell wall biosynthesis
LSGGAGHLAQALVNAQRELGIEAELYSVIQTNLKDRPLQKPLLTLTAALDEYVLRDPLFQSPISVLRSKAGTDTTLNSIDFDLLHLHWAEGVVGERFLREVKKPVVWTLHDFRPVTGACHHPLQCREFGNMCSECPAVRSVFRGLVRESLEARSKTLRLGNIHFVCPSNWVARRLEGSSLLAGVPPRVIYNAVDVDPKKNRNLELARELGLTPDTPPVSVIFGASESPLKGERRMRESDLSWLTGHQVISIGAGSLGIEGEIKTGVISRDDVLEIIRLSTLVVIPSIAETFSLAAFEASALGVAVAGLPGTAVEEIAQKFGHFVSISEPEDLAYFLDQGHQGPQMPTRSVSEMAKEYVELYKEVVQDRF